MINTSLFLCGYLSAIFSDPDLNDMSELPNITTLINGDPKFTAQLSLDWFNKKRTTDNKGVSIPSQRRCIFSPPNPY